MHIFLKLLIQPTATRMTNQNPEQIARDAIDQQLLE
jgi:hypothetical protein